MNNEVEFLTSSVLTKAGILHGWFTKYGGTSTGLFSSLNGKKENGDSDRNVDENRNRALKSVAGDSSFAISHIIHKFKTTILTSTEPGEHKGFDASISTKSDTALSQSTADCGTIIIADLEGSVVALVHGSWHTLSESIICEVTQKLKDYTTGELIAGIGPMICKRCYEYGPKAQNKFNKKYVTKISDSYFVDLKQMILDQLKKSGIEQIDDVNVCTKEDERFFSHRRNGKNSGRFITLAKVAESI